MRRILRFLQAAAVLAFLVPGGCSHLGEPGMTIDHGSPESVLRDFQAAWDNRDFAAMLECIQPSQRPEYAPMLSVAQEHWNAVGDASAAIGDEYGDALARASKQRCTPVVGAPLERAEADGTVDWRKVTLETQGSSAEVRIDGVPLREVALKAIEGAWYLVMEKEETPGPRVSAAMVRASATPPIRKLKDARAAIAQGRLKEDDVYRFILGNAIGTDGPETDNVQIRLIPAGDPVYVRSRPMTFIVHATLVDVRSARMWRMPSLGVGEGVTVEIDGKEIPQPEHRGDVIRGWRKYENGCEQWWFTLPPSCKLARGLHTIRYSFESAGDAGLRRSGAGVLTGRVYSNTMEFFVK